MSEPASAPRVRTLEPFRSWAGNHPLEMPDETLPPADRARPLWRVVETLDLSAA
jgi:hypothetical protein